MMKVEVAFFDCHNFEKEVFDKINASHGFSFNYLPVRLMPKTTYLAKGHQIVCSFAHDNVNKDTLDILKELGVALICLRSAGFNHVDVAHAQKINLPVARVPAYSPYSVAEHAVGLILALNRKIPQASRRVRDLNFSLEGLVGFDLHGKTVGVIGMGKIGQVFASIMRGFGCRILAYDKNAESLLPSEKAELHQVLQNSDIISLHIPLTPQTLHIINKKTLFMMKKGVMLINTGRGGLIETGALIEGLKKEHIGYAGLDVYEEEEEIFFQDRSGMILQDDELARLLTFPNVLITAHQGFLTQEALKNIAETTLENIFKFLRNEPNDNYLFQKVLC